jgi:uncharacterized protein (TIGR02646 family)
LDSLAIYWRKKGLSVIPVKPKPEPANFDAVVRKKGLAWIKKSKLDVTQPMPKGTKIQPFWTACLPDLLEAYGRICAYVCVYIEEVTGSGTVEHFAPKSKRLDLAFEWSNYRLVCGIMNSNKNKFEDVLDPFSMQQNMFQLLVNGEIEPVPNLSAVENQLALKTIIRLKLNSPACRRVRIYYLNKYMTKQITVEYLQERSPFVWLEAKRQGWL